MTENSFRVKRTVPRYPFLAEGAGDPLVSADVGMHMVQVAVKARDGVGGLGCF